MFQDSIGEHVWPCRLGEGGLGATLRDSCWLWPRNISLQRHFVGVETRGEENTRCRGYSEVLYGVISKQQLISWFWNVLPCSCEMRVLVLAVVGGFFKVRKYGCRNLKKIGICQFSSWDIRISETQWRHWSWENTDYWEVQSKARIGFGNDWTWKGFVQPEYHWTMGGWGWNVQKIKQKILKKICEVNIGITWLLMTCYTHGSVHHSTLIGEAVSCNWW